MVSDLVLFPHCDLHVALSGTPTLKLTVMQREDHATLDRYTLTPVTASCAFDFFAPHLEPGPAGPGRLSNLPSVDPATGEVSATTPGVYLFQVRLDDQYIVGRLQVHQDVVTWWFGNDSFTTAFDPDPGYSDIAHAQPSIYAQFSDDATGTDLVGDITGHGYVTLTSTDPSKVTVTPEGRLRGLAETSGGVHIAGSFTGHSESLRVRVVRYRKDRADLFDVQISDLDNVAEQHNMLFLSEGFRQQDEDVFNKIVTGVVESMLTKPRHQPYPMLEGSINVFRAFAPSQQHVLTCGFRVTDEEGAGVPQGTPIPYNKTVGAANTWTPEVLVHRVGLPRRGESRTPAQLRTLWSKQSLTNLDLSKVDDDLIEAWKRQQSVGILHARDTFFGMYLGGRLADRYSDVAGSAGALTPPATDSPTDANLKPFVKRLYEFYDTETTRALTLDPRRHPPELYAGRSHTNPGNSIMAYVNGLAWHFEPSRLIGPVWRPAATFNPSRGLIAVICYDGLIGGSAINNRTMTGLTVRGATALRFAYDHPTAPPSGKGPMRRDPLDVAPDVDRTGNVVAHEFGHSFNLGDEYEDFADDDPEANLTADVYRDNVTRLGFIRQGPAPSRSIDPDKVKWFELPRARLSDRLIAPSQAVPGGIKVKIDRQHIGKWVEAKANHLQVSLRNVNIEPAGRQLPLSYESNQYVVRLDIGDIDEAQGTIVLAGLELPPAPLPTFIKGSIIFVPRRDEAGELMYVVDKKVIDHLKASHAPLNLDPDTSTINDGPDTPVSISGFSPPCTESQLVGIYEGASKFAGGDYRPAGVCKMRDAQAGDEAAAFCYVCKWLIVNRIDPGYHSVLDGLFYPGRKKK